MFDPDRYHRRSIRLPRYNYAQARAYFVTVCAVGRECLLGMVNEEQVMVENEAGTAVHRIWDALPVRFPRVALDAFIVMPNHIHGIVVLQDTNTVSGLEEPREPARDGLSDVLRAFKSLSAIEVNRVTGCMGPVWQRNYYEHIIRNDEDLDRIREYIWANPAM